MLCFSDGVWFYLGFWAIHPLAVSGWAHSRGMGLKLDQSSVSHFHNLCATLNPAHPIGRTDRRSKVMRLALCPSFSTGSLTWSQEEISLGYVSFIVRHLSWAEPCRFLGISCALGFHLTVKCPPFPVISPSPDVGVISYE